VAEASCPRCGAVFSSTGDVRHCPHCGLNCGTANAKFPVKSPRYFRLAFFFGLWLAAYIPFFVNVKWIYWVIASSLLALGLLWSYVSRQTRSEFHDPTAPLNVYASQTDAKSNQFPFPLRHPDTPRQWKALISAPRPRAVYLPVGSRLALLFTILFGIVGGSLWLGAITHRAIFGRVIHWHGYDWLPLFYMAFWIIASPVVIWKEAAARPLLREGEVTIGFLNDGIYRFWTKSGEYFQRATSIGSLEDAITDAGLVPVFYLPQDPTRSVALCSVVSRIRVPSPAQSPEFARISARS
jgi:hypothetical protein